MITEWLPGWKLRFHDFTPLLAAAPGTKQLAAFYTEVENQGTSFPISLHLSPPALLPAIRPRMFGNFIYYAIPT